MDYLKKSEQSLRKSGGSAFYRKIKTVKYPGYKLIFALLLLAGCFMLYYTKIGCVWNYIFGIPCPGCGMTRAFIALLRGDILSSLKHHFMLAGVPVLGLYILFDGRLFKNKSLNTVILILILSGFFVRWILCLTGVLPLYAVS